MLYHFTKIKYINKTKLKKEINEFIARREVVDIKFSISSNNILYSALIIYLE